MPRSDGNQRKFFLHMLSLVHCQHSACLRETELMLYCPVDPSSPSGVQYCWGIRLRWSLGSDKGGFKTLLQTPNSSVGSWAARGRDIHIINSNRTGLLWRFSRPFYWLVQRFPKVCPDFGSSVFGVVGVGLGLPEPPGLLLLAVSGHNFYSLPWCVVQVWTYSLCTVTAKRTGSTILDHIPSSEVVEPTPKLCWKSLGFIDPLFRGLMHSVSPSIMSSLQLPTTSHFGK